MDGEERRTDNPLRGIGPVEKPRPVAESIYIALRDAIVRGDLKPGQRIVEQKLSDRFRVSRVPVREALKKLEQNGFVERLSVRGVMVKEVSEEDIRDTLSILAVLEGHAAARACEQASGDLVAFLESNIEAASGGLQRGNMEDTESLDSRFHQAIVSAAGSKALVTLIGPLRSHLDRYRQYLSTGDKYTQDALEDHRALVEAIRAGDKVSAEVIARRHMLSERPRALKGRVDPTEYREVRTAPLKGDRGQIRCSSSSIQKGCATEAPSRFLNR